MLLLSYHAKQIVYVVTDVDYIEQVERQNFLFQKIETYIDMSTRNHPVIHHAKIAR